MSAKQKIVHSRGPSNTNLGIFVCSLDAYQASKPAPSINYAETYKDSRKHFRIFSIVLTRLSFSKAFVSYLLVIHTYIHTYKLYSRPKKAFQRIQKERKKEKKKLNDNIFESKIKIRIK